jgi:hypothetical protein
VVRIPLRDPKVLDRQVDEVVGPAFQRFDQPKRVSHYTSEVATVAKILGSGTQRATECRSAKGGETDLEVATGTILDVLAELEAEHPSSAKYSLAHSCAVVRETYNDLQLRKRAKIYVVCLTVDPDDPEMWASDFGGNGFGASIEYEFLTGEVHHFTDRGYGLFKVEYDLNQLRIAVKLEMARVLDVAKVYLPIRERHEIVVSGLYRVAAMAATLTKPASCAFQKEWRVAIVPGRQRVPGKKNRVPIDIETPRRPGEPPRTEFRLRAKPGDLPVVVRVVLGPNNLPEKVDEVREQLRALGYGTEKGAMPKVVISSRATIGAKPAA